MVISFNHDQDIFQPELSHLVVVDQKNILEDTDKKPVWLFRYDAMFWAQQLARDMTWH